MALECSFPFWSVCASAGLFSVYLHVHLWFSSSSSPLHTAVGLPVMTLHLPKPSPCQRNSTSILHSLPSPFTFPRHLLSFLPRSSQLICFPSHSAIFSSSLPPRSFRCSFCPAISQLLTSTTQFTVSFLLAEISG